MTETDYNYSTTIIRPRLGMEVVHADGYRGSIVRISGETAVLRWELAGIQYGMPWCPVPRAWLCDNCREVRRG